MKILHLVQKPQLRGVEIFTAQLVSHLEELGHQSILVFLFSGNSELFPNQKKLHLNGKQARRFWDIQAWKKLANIIKEQQPDIIQANAGDTLKYAVFSKLLFGWKQPLFFRNASTISLYIKSWVSKTWNKFLFNHTEKIISVSEASAKDFATLFPACKKKITIIPVGIESLRLNDKNNPHQTNPEAPQLIHVGGFTHEKNHFGLLNIFEKLLDKIPAANLHLVGDGPLKNKVEELVKQKKLETKVIFHGFSNNALHLINNADVLLLPSLIEGLPGVILEAFYCKTPVVAYNVGGIKEILIDKVTGRLIKRGDELAFVDAVIEAIENKPSNHLLLENAYELVCSKYMNTGIAAEFLNLYESMKELLISKKNLPEKIAV